MNAKEGDDLPVVAGAVVDPGVDDSSVDEESPARRAALLSRVRLPSRSSAKGPRSGWRSWVIPVLIVVVLAGAAIGTYIWTQSQYFVGRNDASVAVFRGVNTAFGPLHMYRVVERSDLHYTDLNQAARDQVDSGITATNRRDAEQIIDRLRGRLLPLCITEPTQPPSTAPSSSIRVTPSKKPTPPRRTATPTPTSTAPSPTPTITPQQPGVDCRPAR